ncbi:MAG TPA: RpiB/LacA/LacB family sugar-phosphate isomerase [Acidisarcina sp.]
MQESATVQYSAHQGVENGEMNALVLGSRIVGPALAFDIVERFLAATFNVFAPRFVRRLNKVKAIEQRFMTTAR